VTVGLKQLNVGIRCINEIIIGDTLFDDTFFDDTFFEKESNVCVCVCLCLVINLKA